MSGIVGIYYLDGRPVERADVKKMVDSIAHRGPDGSGVWTDGSIGLGHRMLWTTPESLHKKLPLTNKSGDLTITADARIDNRDELFSTLNFNGRPRETIPDSEIILAAYEKWDEKCPEKLLGDFSFAIWDKRKQTIFCARDPIGIKPFYYYFKDGKFRWSSEPKAIFEDSSIPKEPNLPLICLYLLNRFDEREETLYKDVYRLPPSHSMIIESGKVRKEQYWDIDPNYSIRCKTDEEYAEHFLSLFKDAVRVRLRSHGPVGALLSGGLDSSSIVCTAQMLYKEGVIPNNGFETFSIIFDTFPCDERSYINEVVNKWNIHANYFTYEGHLSSVDFEQTNKYLDVGYFPTILLYGPTLSDAQQKGIRIMLDGVGGDDLLAVDFDHLTDLLFSGNIRKLITQFHHDANYFSGSPLTLFIEFCIRPLIPRYIKIVLRPIFRYLRKKGFPPLVNSAFLKKTVTNEEMKTVVHTIQFPTCSQQHIYRLLFFGWNATVALDMMEKFTSGFSIERRCPFFDRRIMECLLAVPEEQRWDREWPKAILRQSMREILPQSVRHRKTKAEFSPIIDQEFKHRQVSKLNRILKTSFLRELGVIDIVQLERLLENYQCGMVSDGMNWVLTTFLWLELWYQSLIRNPMKGG
jgi:asparagine synthase (glutamine-hydrolysing)